MNFFWLGVLRTFSFLSPRTENEITKKEGEDKTKSKDKRRTQKISQFYILVFLQRFPITTLCHLTKHSFRHIRERERERFALMLHKQMQIGLIQLRCDADHNIKVGPLYFYFLLFCFISDSVCACCCSV